MIRALDSKEELVLTELATKISQIVAAGDLNRLTRTGVLGPAANQHDYAAFHDWFQWLHTRLQELISAAAVKVNTDLDAAMEANTPTGVVNGSPVASIELPAQMLTADDPSSGTAGAIKLVHELTHTMFEAPDFPIKDYTYRGSWGQGYLSGQIGWHNADTYAEAAAQIAEDVDGQPGRHSERGRIPAQREALRLQPLTLGPALAWADIKVNRAWLRSDDYRSFARATVGSLRWQETLVAWGQDPDRSALLRIEDGLRGRNQIIGARYGPLRVGLSPASQTTAENIRRYMTGLKDALGAVELVLTDAAAIRYDKQTKVLEVPRNQVAVSPSALGTRIPDALVAALSYTDLNDRSTAPLNTHKRAIVDLLVDNDRPFEHREMQPLWAGFDGAAAAAPTSEVWAAARIELDLATIKSTAEHLIRLAYVAEGAAGTARQLLESLDKDVKRAVDAAIQLGYRPVQLSAAQERRRTDHFVAMRDALTRIATAVAGAYPDRQPAYDQLIQSLTAFILYTPDPMRQ